MYIKVQGLILVEKAFVESWVECVEGVFRLGADDSSIELHSIAEQHDGSTHLQSSVDEVIPRLTGRGL